MGPMRGMLVSTLMLCQTMSTTGAAESEFKALKCGYTSERCICEERCKCEDLRQSNSATEQCHCEKTECRCEQTGLCNSPYQGEYALTLNSAKGSAMDGCIIVSNSEKMTFAPSSPFTVEAWVRPSKMHNGVVVSKFRIDESGEWWLKVLDNGELEFTRWVDPFELVTEGASIATGKFAHLAATYNGEVMKVYKNSKLVAAQNRGAMKNKDVTSLIMIGGMHSEVLGFPTDVFQGAIDEVRIWTVERTQEQIRSNMGMRYHASDTPFLLGCWQFQEGAGNIAHDLGLQGMHGELRGDSVWSPVVGIANRVTLRILPLVIQRQFAFQKPPGEGLKCHSSTVRGAHIKFCYSGMQRFDTEDGCFLDSEGSNRVCSTFMEWRGGAKKSAVTYALYPVPGRSTVRVQGVLLPLICKRPNQERQLVWWKMIHVRGEGDESVVKQGRMILRRSERQTPKENKCDVLQGKPPSSIDLQMKFQTGYLQFRVTLALVNSQGVDGIFRLADNLQITFLE